jgi:hypothetical protein
MNTGLYRQSCRKENGRNWYSLWRVVELLSGQEAVFSKGKKDKKLSLSMPWRHTGGRGIVQFILNLGTWWRAVNFTPRPLDTRERAPVPVEEEAGWAPEPVGAFWSNGRSHAPTRIRTPGPSRYTDYATPTPVLFLVVLVNEHKFRYVACVKCDTVGKTALADSDGKLWVYVRQVQINIHISNSLV